MRSQPSEKISLATNLSLFHFVISAYNYEIYQRRLPVDKNTPRPQSTCEQMYVSRRVVTFQVTTSTSGSHKYHIRSHSTPTLSAFPNTRAHIPLRHMSLDPESFPIQPNSRQFAKSDHAHISCFSTTHIRSPMSCNGDKDAPTAFLPNQLVQRASTDGILTLTANQQIDRVTRLLPTCQASPTRDGTK